MAGERDLAQPAPGVVADQRRILDPERAQGLGDQVGEPSWGEVGAGHRELVRTERQLERHAAEVGGQRGNDLAPQIRVDERAVDEDDRLPGAGFEGSQATTGKIELPRLAEGRVAPERSLVLAHLSATSV